MRQDRGSSLLRGLFAEHHVYVRSGTTGSYVVLTWPWQVGVTLAVVGIAVWLGLASFGWLAAHLETQEQHREIARLAQANRQLAAQLARPVEDGRALPARFTTLIARLEDVATRPELAACDAAAGGVAQAWRAPPRAGRLAERLLPAAMPAEGSGFGRDWLYDLIAHPNADGHRVAEATRLRAELRAAQAEIARLEDALAAARQGAPER